MSESILRAMRDEPDDAVIEVRVDFRLTVADFRKAVEYGRLKKWTLERDKEWADLVVAAISDGAIQADVDDAFLMTAPDQLMGNVTT